MKMLKNKSVSTDGTLKVGHPGSPPGWGGWNPINLHQAGFGGGGGLLGQNKTWLRVGFLI